MGIISRMKNVVKSKANSAIERARDPEKELEQAILDLEQARKKALGELVGYKAAAKKMERDIEREEARASDWEKRAMAAVSAGNDELAKEALKEKVKSVAEVERIRKDRDEAQSYAIQLNKSRKEAERKLEMLKMRKGTLATQLKAAKSGSVLGVDSAPWERFEAAEDRIDSAAIEAEVQADMAIEEGGKGAAAADEFDRKLLAAGADPHQMADDDPLEALKAKMKAERKKLPPKLEP